LKKLTTILLILMYAMASSGMVVHLHFCCGEFEQLSLQPKSNDRCGHTGMTSMPGCCDNQEVSFSLADDYASAHYYTHAFEENNAAPCIQPIEFRPTLAAVWRPLPGRNGYPPVNNPPPLFLLFGVFRI
jgi:hypothetical protein